MKRHYQNDANTRLKNAVLPFYRHSVKYSVVLMTILLLSICLSGTASAAPSLANLSAGPLDLKLVDRSSASSGKAFQLQIIPRNGVESLSADLTANVFAIKNPTRLVVDIPNFVAGRQQAKRLSHPDITRIRLGVHKNKTRVVIDLNSAGEPSYDIRSDAGLGALVVDFSIPGSFSAGTSTPDLIPTPLAIPSPTPTAIPTPEPDISAVPTPAAEPTMAKTPIFTNDSIPRDTPTPEPEPTKDLRSPSTIPSLPDVDNPGTGPSVTELPGLPGNATGTTSALVKGIYYQTEKNSNVSSVMIDVDGLNTYSLTQRDGNAFELLLEGAALKGTHLSLPQFPPDTFRGFEVIIANERAGNVIVKIYVEDDVTLTPFVVKGKLWLRAN